MESICKKAKEFNFVETTFYRRIYIPEINSHNFIRKSAAERLAINAPIQGSASDIMKNAMIDIHNWIKITKFDVEMLMQVHDELVFEIAESDIENVIPYIKKYMENASKLSVPMHVNFGIGNNWDEAH